MDGELDKNKNQSELPSKNVKALYFEFLADFKDYLAEYVRESVYELTIAEIPIHGTVKLFDGYTSGQVKIKNQGETTCFLSTTGMGGYRLEPGESLDFFVNTQVIATTISGSTVLGFVKS